MGLADLVKSIIFSGGSSIQSGNYVSKNIESDTNTSDCNSSDEELSVAEERDEFERDEFDIFGESVASKLRMIEMEKIKSRVLKDIDAIICDAILGQGTYGPLTRKLQRIENLELNFRQCIDKSQTTTEITEKLPYY